MMAWLSLLAPILLMLFLVGAFAEAREDMSSQKEASLFAPPNILFMVADDLGYNDVSHHGSRQIPTPSIDEIANTGISLTNYHVQPVCSPTRASLLSGRHAIHHGIYMPFAQGTALRLNLSYTLLPAHLRQLGYATHAVGKWHLGQNEVAALPTSRGFDTYLGYWAGAEDYYLHDTRGAYDFAGGGSGNGTGRNVERGWAHCSNGIAFDRVRIADVSDGLRSCLEANETYSTFLFAQRAVEIIESSGLKPFFLYLAWQNVHWPLQVPSRFTEPFVHSTGGDGRRLAIAGMVAALDAGVGNVSAALKRVGKWDSTLFIFTSDNGGPTNGNEGTSSNNFPMRGGKNTLWEGGTRVVAAVRGSGVAAAGTRSDAMIHAVDWFPTLLHVASGDANWQRLAPLASGEPPFSDGDGVDVFATVTRGAPVRDQLLLECHADAPSWQTYVRQPRIRRNASLINRASDHDLAASLLEAFEHREGYLEAGDDLWPSALMQPTRCLAACAADAACAAVSFKGSPVSSLLSAAKTPIDGIVRCEFKRAVRFLPEESGVNQVHGNAIIIGDWKLLHLGSVHPADEAGWHPPPGQDVRSTRYTLGCDVSLQPAAVDESECVETPCVFNVKADPCEYHNLAPTFGHVKRWLEARLDQIRPTAVPPVRPQGCLPIIVDGVWRPCDDPLVDESAMAAAAD